MLKQIRNSDSQESRKKGSRLVIKNSTTDDRTVNKSLPVLQVHG